jgi:pimeloyl-ACP methyl ester carboxylesterase
VTAGSHPAPGSRPGQDGAVRTVRSDGLVLDVATAGPPGAEPVVLLHGFPQSATCWAAVTPLLATRGLRTHAPDQRGYSPGARPTGRWAYRPAALDADAMAVIDAAAGEVGPGTPVHLVGHDLGALVAWRVAARHPDRVRTLAALSVPPPRTFLRSVLTSRQVLASWYVAAFQLPWLPERVLAPAPGRPYSDRFVRVLRGTGQTHDAAVRDAAALADPAALTAALNWYRGLPAGTLDGWFPPVTVPTMLVWSDGDTAVVRASVEGARRDVAGPYRFVEMRGVSHWIPDAAPAALADLLVEHIS